MQRGRKEKLGNEGVFVMVNTPRAQGTGTVQPSLDDFRTAACEAGDRGALDTPITVDMNRNVRAVRFKGHLWTQKAAGNDGPRLPTRCRCVSEDLAPGSRLVRRAARQVYRGGRRIQVYVGNVG